MKRVEKLPSCVGAIRTARGERTAVYQTACCARPGSFAGALGDAPFQRTLPGARPHRSPVGRFESPMCSANVAKGHVLQLYFGAPARGADVRDGVR